MAANRDLIADVRSALAALADPARAAYQQAYMKSTMPYRGANEPSIGDRNFFLRKAIGWSLREYAKVAPGWVSAYVSSHADRLSGLSRREALKHIGS